MIYFSSNLHDMTDCQTRSTSVLLFRFVLKVYRRNTIITFVGWSCDGGSTRDQMNHFPILLQGSSSLYREENTKSN